MAYLQPHGRFAIDPGLATMQYAWSKQKMILHEDVFEHIHLDADSAREIAAIIEAQETIELKTVGIDIGSSTSHLLFAKVLLAREAQDLSSRYVPVQRQVVWK